ncbi:CinA family nicotinamide mononucleotide deamidase-related protein [bacterium]|nr:CinA family nicotinamide mononucleotide deamidase-related protein [bacterium]MBU1675172.1 CinA family nicotinamide mononucleotide deamidase-related protein [bacterium]
MVKLTRAWLVVVGDELLNGRTVDTNSSFMQRRLANRGVRVDAVTVVPDRADRISAALDAVPAGALVVVTGGLGPTRDDLTAETVAAWAGAPLRENDAVARHLRAMCAQRGYPYAENMVKQGLLPAGLDALLNPLGTAPAMAGELCERTLVLLPGVPQEVRAMWESVEAWLSARGRLGDPLPGVLMRTVRFSEPGLAKATEALRGRHSDLDWSWWLTRWGVDVQAAAPSPAVAWPERLAGDLAAVLGDHVYARDLRGLHEVVQADLIAGGWTVAVAESCTGGLLGAALTENAGSSACFLGGALTYADAVKTSALGVAPATLESHGAVSVETAREMAAGCRERFGSDHALSITGIAGPDGGSPDKPVGTVCLGLASACGVYAGHYRLGPHRYRNRELAVSFALDALRRHLASAADPFAGRGGEARR